MSQATQDPAATHYSRRDALRILHLRERQLAAWERGKILTRAERYSFEGLSQLRTVRDLRAKRLSLRSIRESFQAIERTAGVRNALLEASAVRHGSRVVFRHNGTLIDPVTAQLAFDFAAKAGEPLRVMAGAMQPQPRVDVQELFKRAVRLEEAESTRSEAAELYQSILEHDAYHAPSAINLGTLRYGERRFAEAERWYRLATEADPEYALAFFDLGNVLDEMQRVEEAIDAYRRAISLVPQYADAHYNLALAYERKGERRRALRHWLMYVRLDPVGPWASHAKTQAKKILSSERLTIVSRRSRLGAAC